MLHNYVHGLALVSNLEYVLVKVEKVVTDVTGISSN
jgi:hypothetical protein